MKIEIDIVSTWITQRAIQMLTQQGVDPFSESNSEQLSLYMGFVLGRLYEQAARREGEKEQAKQALKETTT